MSKRNWEKARRRSERQEDWKLRKLGAVTDKRVRYVKGRQAQLRAEFLKRGQLGPRPEAAGDRASEGLRGPPQANP
jgi:hypothetical protein